MLRIFVTLTTLYGKMLRATRVMRVSFWTTLGMEKTLKKELEMTIGSRSSLSRSRISYFRSDVGKIYEKSPDWRMPKQLFLSISRILRFGLHYDKTRRGRCVQVQLSCERWETQFDDEKGSARSFNSITSFKRWVRKRVSEHPKNVSSNPGLLTRDHNVTSGVFAPSGHPNRIGMRIHRAVGCIEFSALSMHNSFQVGVFAVTGIVGFFSGVSGCSEEQYLSASSLAPSSGW